MRSGSGLRGLTLLSSLFSLPLFLGCRDAFTTNVDVVARAGDAELTVDRLAEIFAQGKALAVQRNVIERFARLWVDYSLFAQRSVAGDSLLDSATVVATLWPEVQQRVADHFHEGLVGRMSAFDSSRVDSAYAAGEYRLLQHILVSAGPTIAPPARNAKRQKAAELRSRLASGGTWAEANRSNEDARAKAAGGSIGVRGRGELPPAFENAAFALNPGEISDVVESGLGYHIIRRPALREQRAAFASGVEDRVVGAMDSLYLAGLLDRRHVTIKRDAPAMVRAALADPHAAANSGAVLGTLDGGRFTVSDLLRWVNAMSAQVQQEVPRAGDQQIRDFIRALMRNHAMMVEADSAGVRLTALDVEEFRDMLRRNLDRVRTALALNEGKLKDTLVSITERQKLAALHVDTYLEAVSNNTAAFVDLPPFLSARLRNQSRWEVSSAGVERALERSGELRAVVDSLRPATPPDTGRVNAND